MNVRENVTLADYTTMKIGGPARYFVDVTSKDELVEAIEFGKKQKLALKVIGGGSNIIFSDTGFSGLVIHNQLKGRVLQGPSLQINGGEVWDEAVAKAVAAGLSGIEALSAIPGSAGATPVQNVGAYGQEVANTLIDLEAYDLEKDQFVTLTREQCEFSYRNSIFKDLRRSKDRYIITSVRLQLDSKPPEPPFYSGIEEYLREHGLEPSVDSLRKAVVAIRAFKLPDPSVVPNNGSFFHNPFVDELKLHELLAKYPDMPHFPTADPNENKLAAGWLVEQAGFDKDQTICGLKTYKNHALVLTNPDGKGWQDLQCAIEKIRGAVQDRFRVTLSIEPELIS